MDSSQHSSLNRATLEINPSWSPEQQEISALILEFLNSNDIELALDQFSKPRQRTFIHEIADVLGLYHRADGRGKFRHVTIRKGTPPAKTAYFDTTASIWKEYFELPDQIKANLFDGELKCLTFNVLHDPTDPGVTDITYTELRRPLCFQFLKESNSTIITLNEVSKEFYHALLDQEWIRENYYISEFGDTNLTPGNLILSKLPIKSSYCHQLKMSQKIINIVEILMDGLGIPPIVIATGHLKAGPVADFSRMRACQLKEMVDQLKIISNAATWIIMGDLNIRTGEKEDIPLLRENGFIDSWEHCHPGDEGFTYDPWNNSLAEVLSERVRSFDQTRTKISNRYDRILIRDPSNPNQDGSTNWRIEKCEILASNPLGTFPNGMPLYISDHFALQTIFKLIKPNQDCQN